MKVFAVKEVTDSVNRTDATNVFADVDKTGFPRNSQARQDIGL